MINRLHSLLRSPHRGFDPIDSGHADRYEKGQIDNLDYVNESISQLCSRLGGVKGQKILDLGGGPGHCSMAFARQGGVVTWHDVSATYMEKAKARAEGETVNIDFSLGYMEDAMRIFGVNSFDLIYQRICWFYCMNDRAFSNMIFNMVKPGGWIFVDNYIPRSGIKGWRYNLNRITGFKIGHPFPAPGVVPALFASQAPSFIEVQRHPDSEFILVQR